jgi:hypothetical protein
MSSNPAGAGAPITDPDKLSVRSSDSDLFAYEDGAFDQNQRPGIVEGTRLVDREGTVGKAVRYWVWTLANAHVLLGRTAVPGHDYALTEAVHCGSPNEQGDWSALRTCATLYLERVLEASPALVVVVVGSVAKYAFEEHLLTKPASLSGPTHLFGPIELGQRERLLVVVPHPSSFGGNRPLSARLSDVELERVRRTLSAGIDLAHPPHPPHSVSCGG